jgi:isopenicillin N synthase-like dioxygenase
MTTLPIIDLTAGDAAVHLHKACRDVGFFALVLNDDLHARRQELIALATGFFALPDEVKQQVFMDQGGSAWRGWFPLGGELTSGIPDLKEGYYFGEELEPDPRPMHGANLWPDRPAGLTQAVSNWMDEMQSLGQQLLSFMGEGLGLTPDFFSTTLTGRPTPLFRIFRYPPQPSGDESNWGVREHSDYGLLTLLATDGTPGLEVMVNGDWIAAPADPKLLICNLGDMLDRLTAGRYRSTRHRVRNHAGQDRYALPFFLDPGWDASIEPLDLNDGWVAPQDATDRWDRADVRDLGGTYGDWLTAKVANVFPALAGDVGVETVAQVAFSGR